MRINDKEITIDIFVYIGLVSFISYFISNSIIFILNYFLVEKYFLVNKITTNQKTIIIIFILLIISFIFNKINIYKLKVKTQLMILLIVSFLTLGSSFYLSRITSYWKEIPKIHLIKPKSGMQGTIITLYGNNFGEEFEKGTVLLGNEELVIKYWSNTKIKVEQPVPNNFGKKELKIIKINKKLSDPIEYTVINPSKL
ncbi:MAG: hypothetical protein AUK08_01655 [Candidatus Pacebacteria bacterium CG2_30_36_39]|nr:MAG: hypothetical protein AUK08_01655 [Candidatus Pacebacteria bacterium CG2_30_36_39]